MTRRSGRDILLGRNRFSKPPLIINSLFNRVGVEPTREDSKRLNKTIRTLLSVYSKNRTGAEDHQITRLRELEPLIDYPLSLDIIEELYAMIYKGSIAARFGENLLGTSLRPFLLPPEEGLKYPEYSNQPRSISLGHQDYTYSLLNQIMIGVCEREDRWIPDGNLNSMFDHSKLLEEYPGYRSEFLRLQEAGYLDSENPEFLRPEDVAPKFILVMSLVNPHLPN